MRRPNPVFLPLVLLFSLLLESSSARADTETDRLVALGKLWGKVRYFHPWLRYKPIDWDAALVKALPKIRAAASPDKVAEAVGQMLATLGDPMTRVERKAPKAPPAPVVAGKAPEWTRWEKKTLVVALGPMARAMNDNPYAFAQPLAQSLGAAEAVVVDARIRGADLRMVGYGLMMVGGEFVPEEVSSPATRAVVLNGYPPQTGFTTGGYHQGFVEKPGDTFKPRMPVPARRLAFVVDPEFIPEVAIAAAAAGKASIVATGAVPDIAPSIRVPIEGDFEAVLRVGEVLGPAAKTVTAKPGEDPMTLALSLVAKPMRATRDAAKKAPTGSPPPLAQRDARYEEMTYPTPEYRLLAVFRLWNVVRYFYPYLDLIDPWEPALPEFVPKILAAKDGTEYYLTLLEMAARVADGHVGLNGHPALAQHFGMAISPVALRFIEGKPTVVDMHDATAAGEAGLKVGDVLVAVDGEPVEAKIKRLSPYVPASTLEAKQTILGRLLLRGAEGAVVTATVRGADEKPRPAKITLSMRYYASASSKPSGPSYRLLEPGIGYADLRKLMPAEVDAMLEAFKGTRAIVFDMRGYPNGTVLGLGPRINVKKAKIGARFRRPLWSGFDLGDADQGNGASYSFEQPLPEPSGTQYTGKTVMIIDERAQSQAEHTCLFFEAAAGTTFVGTPTAGANGDVTMLSLPGGMMMSFSGHDVRHADGRQLQRLGIQPHVRVAPTLAGIRAGKDEVLDRAWQVAKAAR